MSNFSYRFSVFGNHYEFTPKFTLFSLAIMAILCALGLWQSHQGQEIRELAQLVNKRINAEPLNLDDLRLTADLRFYPVVLRGSFDDDHQILLPTRARHGQQGFEVLTPFKPVDSAVTFLVDRGWLIANTGSHNLPRLRPIPDGITISGILFKPISYWMFSSDFDEKNLTWPLLSKRANLKKFSKVLNAPFFPYIVLLSPNNPYGFEREWGWLPAMFNPERNDVFAKQWYALAFVMFLVFIVANIKRA